MVTSLWHGSQGVFVRHKTTPLNVSVMGRAYSVSQRVGVPWARLGSTVCPATFSCEQYLVVESSLS